MMIFDLSVLFWGLKINIQLDENESYYTVLSDQLKRGRQKAVKSNLVFLIIKYYFKLYFYILLSRMYIVNH